MPIAIPRKLIVLGDSGVYGWGDPDEGGWCERLRRHWMGLPGGPVLYPLGVRGDGLERVAARLEQEVQCRGELRRQLPHGILLAVGLNDSARVGRPDGRHQLDAEGFLFGLQQLLHQARRSAPVLVLGMTGFGFFKGLYDANIWATLYDYVPPERRANAVSTMNSVGWLGGGIAPVAIAAASQHFGMAACLSATSAIYLAFGLFLLIGTKKWTPSPSVALTPAP